MSVTLRTIVTGPEAGSIIGRGGDVINNIRDESKAKIKIEGSSATERIITVEGPTDAIFKAYTQMCKILEQREKKEAKGRSRSRTPEGDVDLDLSLLVPASQCGALIGKEGAKIKEMRNTTGADIHISSDSLPDSSEREVRVKGSREEVTQCIFHICGLLLENPPKGEPKLYRPDRGFTERERGGGGGGGRSMDSGRDRRDDRDYYDSLPSLSSSRSSLYARRRDDYSPPSRYGGGGSHYGSSMGGGSNPFDAILEFARRHDGGSRSRDRNEREIRFEMFVANDTIGSVIGRKGSKINEIRSMSGARINILESGKSGARSSGGRSPEPDRERIIEIAGTQEQVTVAKSLITIAMELQDGRGGGDPDRRGGGGGGDDRRGFRGGGGGDRDRSRSRDRNSRYDDRRRW